MSQTESELRQQIVEIGRLIYQKGWVAANDGNITARLGPDRILSTPTQVSKGLMREEDLIVCDMLGNRVQGTRERTSEILMHLTIYEMRPDVMAVVHAHPPVATGFAVAGRALNQALLPEVIINLGSVPLTDYGLPGTSELSEKLRPFIPSYDALLMANHGAVTCGADLFRAFFNMETVEHFARITLVAELLGGPKPLPRDEVDKLWDARSRYGLPERAGIGSVCPASQEPDASASRYVTRDEIAVIIDEFLRVRR
ncbi:MAG: class II aldolase/adducin family protein [Bryobacteraceae bacterium]|nr:class II aldolase/adducin family protein [Bryobacteraceae bacterium]